MQPATTHSPEPPDNIARQLRSAVLAGDHAAAGRLAPAYAEAVRALWESLPETDRAASPLATQASELLAWAREMTLVQRALAADHLAIVETAQRYGAKPDPECSRAIAVRA